MRNLKSPPRIVSLRKGQVWETPNMSRPSLRPRRPAYQVRRGLGFENVGRTRYFRLMVKRSDGYIPPCIPSRAYKPPAGPGWVHEIKHDGYRLQVRRERDAVRLFTRRGFDWTERYPAIAAAALKVRSHSFTLDGEAVVCGSDGIAIFNALHRRGTVREAILQAFDLLELAPQETLDCFLRTKMDTLVIGDAFITREPLSGRQNLCR